MDKNQFDVAVALMIAKPNKNCPEVNRKRNEWPWVLRFNEKRTRTRRIGAWQDGNMTMHQIERPIYACMFLKINK